MVQRLQWLLSQDTGRTKNLWIAAGFDPVSVILTGTIGCPSQTLLSEIKASIYYLFTKPSEGSMRAYNEKCYGQTES